MQVTEALKAIYVHCAAHKLNLAVVSAAVCFESYIGEISWFLKFSPKRQQLLDKVTVHHQKS